LFPQHRKQFIATLKLAQNGVIAAVSALTGGFSASEGVQDHRQCLPG
jgi:hypothetical protein